MGPEDRKPKKKGKEFFSCRDILWYLTFSGFAMNAMLENTVSLTIIAMVPPRSKPAVVAQCTDDVQIATNRYNISVNESSRTNSTRINVMQISVPALESTIRSDNTTPSNPVQYSDRLPWNEYEQGLALGGIFWLHWLTQLPGGSLSRRYGTKLVFGWANLVTAILGFLLPICAHYHLYAFVAIRVVQGLCTGFSWPSMHNLTAKWIPLTERSRFISSYLGSSIGTALTYPLCATLINWFGWASVFYVISALGVLWYIAWYYLVYDTPQKHPRITETEKSHILRNLGDTVNHVSLNPVPWKAILSSGPMWITAIAYCGGCWGLYTIGSEAPSYFYNVHGWNIGVTGLLSAAPQVIRMVFSYMFSSFADWILRTGRMSTTSMRKFAMIVCNGVQGLLFLGLALSGCQPTLAIVFMILGTAASGSLAAGTLAGCIDLSPNYASIILGVCNTLTVFAGIVVPLLVGILTNNNQTIGQWQLVFIITAGIILLAGTPYMFYGTSELQPWNNAGNEGMGEEVEKLRSNVDGVNDEKARDLIADNWLHISREKHTETGKENYQSR